MSEKFDTTTDLPENVRSIVEQYGRQYRSVDRVGRLWESDDDTAAEGDFGGGAGNAFAEDIQSSQFDASHLQQVVEQIKDIEEGLKTLIAARTRKVVEESVPVERRREVRYGFLRRALARWGVIRQRYETVTEFETVRKEVPREPDEVAISEFRTMIDRYIDRLGKLNEGLENTVREVDGIVQNLTAVSDAYTDQIHRDRKGFYRQMQRSRELARQLEDVAAVHNSLNPLSDRFPEVEKARDHLEMALRESQGMEFKLKTSIDMNSTYHLALKSYRKLINDFRERGDIHVTMVENFAQGASHMKIAVDNVSQICSGVARVTQSMILIVESIEGGNKVLGQYAALIGEGVAHAPEWNMEYEELQQAEAVYLENDERRLRQLEGNRREIEALVSGRQAAISERGNSVDGA
jgi:hypothetical protein